MKDLKKAKLATYNVFSIVEQRAIKKKGKTFYLCYLQGRSHFEDAVTQNYLVFQPVLGILRRLVVIFQHEHQKDCLVEVIKLLMHLIIVLL